MSTPKIDNTRASRLVRKLGFRLVMALVLIVVGYISTRQRGDEPQGSAEKPVTQSPTKTVKDKHQPTPAVEQTPAAEPSTAEKEADDTTKIASVVIRNEDGKVVYRGAIDLAPTLKRIADGDKLSHRNDGTVFQNRERRLPKQSSGYYHEWVHPTQGLAGPGPQRVITGGKGEVYYTPDHYQSFQRIK